MAQEAVDVCLRVLKESNKRNFDSYSVRNSVLIISHITFRDCRVHIFADNLSQNSCMVVTTSRVKLRKTEGKRPRRQWFDVEKLQNLKVSSTFALHLKNNFQVLGDLEDYMQSDKKDGNFKWEQGKKAYCKFRK